MCMIESKNYADIWREKVVTARMVHFCNCCIARISPGEKYMTHFSLHEGDCGTGCLCIECKSDREVFAAAHNGFVHAPRDFFGAVYDCVADGDEESELKWKPMIERIEASRTNYRKEKEKENESA